MNEYILDLDRFAEINKLKDENQLNPIVNTSRRAVPGKKIIMILLLIMSAVTLAAIYLLSAGLDNPQAEKVDKDIYEKMVNELQTERALVEQEKQRLAEHERNLKKFEAELNTKYSDYARKVQQLEEKEMEFNSKVDLRFMNRQTIETYENIDPEQAAILLKNLYIKDPSLVILIMKKISGRKAGRILDALLLTDRDLATKIAEETLNFYRPK